MSTDSTRSTAPAGASMSRDPATGELIAERPFLAEGALDPLLDRAQAGFARWSGSSLAQRADVLRAMAAALRQRSEAMAAMATAEMGKPLRDMRAEVEKCAQLCEWYAGRGPRLLADEPTEVPDGKAHVSYLPLGVVLGVMPWNFPYWQAMRAAVPILMGGNAFLLKPAENVVGCAELLDAAWRTAGLAEDAFIAAHLSRAQSATAIADRRVAAVTVTGSVGAGRSIAAQAGQAIKKVVLELGGSDPFIVLADADVEKAAEIAVAARFQNAGQVCIAAKRMIVEQAVLERFTKAFVEHTRALVVGDGRDAATQVGPMARLDLLEQLHQQVTDSVQAGATLLLGGHRLDRAGFFYAPTVLADVRPGMPVFDAETFGPVAAIVAARDAEHAVELANRSDYGLSGNLWTGDVERGKRLARRLVTGGVFINGWSASDPRVPIGGVKHSGFGRELSHFGLREFVNAQTVWVDRL